MCCITYYVSLSELVKGKRKPMLFTVPMVWSKPTTIRLVPRGVSLPIPRPPIHLHLRKKISRIQLIVLQSPHAFRKMHVSHIYNKIN
ncbi:hypothetical protein PR048_012271 [Dryococelus australis]|uniref:Uncharacterized protein n=1 Tax=Dryococelus australis TaxID=614101 RepID=A0ABQ9HNW4_9NEOP|nr:hypothetical protein PR048_012271 [Dryococelus australis]